MKLLAAGGKNLAAFLWALAQDGKKLSGQTNMSRLLKEGKELKVFHIRENDLEDFRAFAKKSVLYSVIKDTRSNNGMVDLITNTDYIAQVNHFMESRGYTAPNQKKGAGEPKNAAPRAPQENSWRERGNGLTPSQTRTRTTNTPTSDRPSVKGRLAALQAASEGMRPTPTPKRTAPQNTR